jgi:hypothetical protein
MVPERGFCFWAPGRAHALAGGTKIFHPGENSIGFENAVIVTQNSYLAFAPAEAEILEVRDLL